jgi:hypothetical protein
MYNLLLPTAQRSAPVEGGMPGESKFADPKAAWHKVLERLYHEDHILYARMNNFSTVQAFLATALAFTTSATTTAHNISLIVNLFGLALSVWATRTDRNRPSCRWPRGWRSRFTLRGGRGDRCTTSSRGACRGFREPCSSQRGFR